MIIHIDDASAVAATRAQNPDAVICVETPAPKPWAYFIPGSELPVLQPNGGPLPPRTVRP